MSFISKGSQISAFRLKGSFKSKTSIQEYRNEIHKLMLNLCMSYMVHASSKSEEVRINHLTPLLVMTMSYVCWFMWWVVYIEDLKWCLCSQIGVAFWRVVLWEVYFEGPNRVWRALKTSFLNTDSTTSRLWKPRCTRYWGVMECWHGCVINEN